ncbi:MAG: glycosyltransferase [candidate division Zixibacteria bacterium]|nr:glycosyltransferase [candidate division Zixibacteria bacterium]
MTSSMLDRYAEVAGPEAVAGLHQMASRFDGQRVVHVNSTRTGGGVAEILFWMVPLMRELGLDVQWEVIEGDARFYEMTKSLHNGLQGRDIMIPPKWADAYHEANRAAAERLGPMLADADFVFIHDPQPAELRSLITDVRGHWVWRCHIDVSHPSRVAWKFLRPFVELYEASIFSMPQFSQAMTHSQFIIAPSIDPLSEKNIELPQEEIDNVRAQFELDPERPLLVQVSRFDRFKDPLGVIEAYRLVRRYAPVQLVLAGGGATDDPEGAEVLNAVQEEAADDPDLHVLFLPGDAHRTINALQRAADIVIQKSTREGFGLTVTEGMWKSKPVIGGNTGGIRLQVFDYGTGFLVNSPEGAAHRILYLLRRPNRIQKIGEAAREFVREYFLNTRHLREYLTLMLGLSHGITDRIFANGE